MTSVSTWKNLADGDDDDDDDDEGEDQYISNTAIQQYNKNNILRKRIKVSVGKGTFFEDALEVDARVGEQVAVPQEVEHRLEVVRIPDDDDEGDDDEVLKKVKKKKKTSKSNVRVMGE